MTELSRAEEVQAELHRADKSLQAARSLLEDHFLEDALMPPVGRCLLKE
jgi:uncharacterized protein (UPF0332 family)